MGIKFAGLLICIFCLTALFLAFSLHNNPERVPFETVQDDATQLGPRSTAGFKAIDPTKSGIYTLNAIDSDKLLQPIEHIPSDAPSIRSDVPGLELLRYNREGFKSFESGDNFTLKLAKLEPEVEVWIESRQRHPSGNLTLNGKVNGLAEHSFVMTIGTNSIFATISTPHGIYNLRGNKEYLWLALGRSFNHHVDGSQPDFRILEPSHIQETNS